MARGEAAGRRCAALSNSSVPKGCRYQAASSAWYLVIFTKGVCGGARDDD